MARRSMSPTIVDVARRSGVSPATVSRVMNGKFLGDPAVADRVRAAAQELDYRPSTLARSLALGRTSSIGFMVPDLGNPAFQAVLTSLSKAAARDGYRVLVGDSAESPSEEGPLSVELRRRCDALVLCAPRMSESELTALADQFDPLVLINRRSDAVAVPSLSIDYVTGIGLLAAHLYDLGHRTIVYLEGPEDSVSNRHRLRGLEQFQRDHDDVTLQRMPGGAGIDAGLAAAPAIAASDATAVLAYNDLVAIGVLHKLAELGVDVPGRVSVAGFDGIPFAAYTSPALTTASAPHDELGREAWRRMSALLTGADAPGDLLLEPRLEVRASTAARR
ncbi:LacI family DNA-binding transcriptional regulator [Gryllotalpicola ginsengisoli]|uniref:LacI family DNA-binding transcriptional regulator n=1 Tax=Gryllotalpicola ginsengisoli TaxID=444608 RepID=UPI0003B66644|nr:LacI family DNA-binding transcriptional regulator [Gryllotalpicola ginsengisoli]